MQQYFQHFNTWDFHYITYAGIIDENRKYVGILETVYGIRYFSSYLGRKSGYLENSQKRKTAEMNKRIVGFIENDK